jgi:hypothetical protein
MLLSWFLPWWGCSVPEYFAKDVVVIRPWGLETDLGAFAGYIHGSEMPVWFAPLTWIYLVIAIALLLFSLLAKEKAVSLGKFKLSLPQVLIGGVGLSYIVTVVLAVIVIAIRAGDFFDTPLQGYITIDLGEGIVSGAWTSLRLGYWLACAVGPLCIVLALLRDKIIGKPS